MSESQPIKSISNLILAMQEPGESKRRASSRRSAPGISAKLFEKSREGHHETRGTTMMKSLRVRSNFARNRVVMLGDLVLRFDSTGHATMPEHQLSILKSEMRVRPGRYHILQEEVVSDVPAVEVVPEVKEQIKDLLLALKTAEKAETIVAPVESDGAIVLKVDRTTSRPQRRQTRKKESKEE